MGLNIDPYRFICVITYLVFVRYTFIDWFLNGRIHKIPIRLALLGSGNSTDPPQIGRNKLFLPKFLMYDGNYLWVGEVKFSNRLMRFSHN